MSLGKRNEQQQQQEFWAPTALLSRGPGHVFYDQLNAILKQARFDQTLEQLCEPYYAGPAVVPFRRGPTSVCC